MCSVFRVRVTDLAAVFWTIECPTGGGLFCRSGAGVRGVSRGAVPDARVPAVGRPLLLHGLHPGIQHTGN